MKSERELILFCGHYLPGYKAGGILRTVANMVANLSGKINIGVVTRDRDHGDTHQYKNIEVNKWIKYKNDKVFYFSKSKMNLFAISSFFNKNKKKNKRYFFNSFFEKFTVYYFISSFFAPFYTMQDLVFLAPRGEFLDGCLEINKTKKKLYMTFFRIAYHPKKVHWIFSDQYEYNDFRKKFPIKINKYTLLNDIPTIFPLEKNKSRDKEESQRKLKVVYLARVSPEKNVDIAIKIVQKTKRPIEFDIYGPISDIKYWEKCTKQINEYNSKNISYKGELLPNQVSTIFSKYDIFLYPTGGDNFGHTIVESISQGTPVLISENSPWNNLNEKGWGWNVPLSNLKGYYKVLEEFEIENPTLRNKKREIIRKSLLEYLDLKSLVDTHLNVFNA